MGYELEAFLGRSEEMKTWSRELPSAVVCRLSDELGLVPLIDELYAELAAFSPSGKIDLAFWASRASRATSLAYVEASYFGGRGSQTGTLWRDGKVLRTDCDINTALAHFGAARNEPDDLFDTVGMGRHRKTNGWAVEAILAEVLAQGGDPIPTLIKTLRHSRKDEQLQASVRQAAARTLAQHAAAALPAAKALRESLYDPGYGVSLAAASALAALGAQGLQILRTELEAQELAPDRLWGLAFALGEMGAQAAAAAPALARTLKHVDEKLRSRAAESLGQIGPGARSAAPELLAALKDASWPVRHAAAESLGLLGATEAIPNLEEMRDDPDKLVRSSAIEALNKLRRRP